MTLYFHSHPFIRLILIEIILLSLLLSVSAESSRQLPASGDQHGVSQRPQEGHAVARRDAASARNGQRKKTDRRSFQGDDVRSGAKTRYSGKMYFAIAATTSGQIYSRAFNKTLANITQSYLSGKSNLVTYNISLETMVIELPESGSFSSMFLEVVCRQFEGRHVVAVLVVGNSRAAFTVALAAGHAGVPVLWARGTNTFLPGFNNLVSLFLINVLNTSLFLYS